MLSYFYPDLYLESAAGIDYQKFYQMGYRGLLFDIDNTLVRHGEPGGDRIKEFFEKLRQVGFQTCLISNNKEPRVSAFAKEAGSQYISNAHKPFVKNYKEAMKRIGTTPENTLFIGDQLFTDVLGAKRCKIKSILVKPVHPKEELQIVIKRFPEKIVLRSYAKWKKKKNRG